MSYDPPKKRRRKLTGRALAAARRNIKKARAALGRPRRAARRAAATVGRRIGRKRVYSGLRGGYAWVGPKVRRYDPGPIAKLSRKLIGLDWLFGLLGFFFGVTRKEPTLSAKPTSFIESIKSPQTHLPASADEYWARLKDSMWFAGGAAAAVYGYVAPYIPVLGPKLPFKAVAKNLGVAAAVGSAVGSLIDDPPKGANIVCPSTEGVMPSLDNAPLALNWEAEVR